MRVRCEKRRGGKKLVLWLKIDICSILIQKSNIILYVTTTFDVNLTTKYHFILDVIIY